MSFNRIRPIAL